MATVPRRPGSTVRSPRGSVVPVVMVVGAAAVLGGCGGVSEKEKPSGARPPATLQVSAVSTDDGVVVSPRTIGGGPVRVVFSNQSSRSVRPALENGAGASRGAREEVAPGGVATIQATLDGGTWKLRVAAGRPAASLVVTRQRPSSDDALLLP